MQRLNKIIYLSFVVCVIALILSVRQCNNNAADYSQSKNYISSQNDTIHYLKNGIAQKAAVEVSPDLFKSIVQENEALSKLLKDAKIKLGNVKQSTRIVTITQIDTIAIALHDTIPCPEFKPIAFNVDSVHYSIAGLVSKHSITISKINLPDSTYVITATKPHFFRKDEYLVTVKHSNPYIKTIGLTNLTVIENKKWWQNGWLKIGASFVAGGYLTYKLTH